MASPTVSSMTSFGGGDLNVTFGNQTVGDLQGISWSIQREKAPVFVLGRTNAISFSRGKRVIAGGLQFAHLDYNSLIAAIKRVWDQVAPKAMFTPAGNNALANSEDLRSFMDNLNWAKTTSEAGINNFTGPNGSSESGWGFSGTSVIKPIKKEGSNGAPSRFDKTHNYFVEEFSKGDDVYVPAGFDTMKGDNIQYADQLPAFDACMTFGNEYGQTAFQKVFYIDILNESSGVTINSITTEVQMTYIARQMSPLIRGVYSRNENGVMKGIQPTDV